MPWRADGGSSDLDMSMDEGFQRETSQPETCKGVVGGTGDKVTILRAYIKCIKRIKLSKRTKLCVCVRVASGANGSQWWWGDQTASLTSVDAPGACGHLRLV